ncbi:MAG: efflux RND transporter periplasmic adaptor subunit [bacterium]
MRSSIPRILVIVLGTILLVAALFFFRRSPEEKEQPEIAPLVRTTVAEARPHRFRVKAQGTVEPRTESELIPQVSGEVLWISSSLAAGGFFEEGELLARIDDADYRVDREAARAAVARAESQHARAEKELERQQRLADRSVASQSRIDDAVNDFKVAEASLREARARLERAERDLARTRIVAPYRGRVRSEQVDIGQFVTRGAPIATLYGVEFAEVRLPLPDRELAFLDVPLLPEIARRDEDTEPIGAPVELRAEFAGARHRWQGHLVRTEGELDPRSRMVQLVVRVPDPFGLDEARSAPLAVGLFVEAEIAGQLLEEAIVLPREALRPGGRVYVVGEDGRLRFRVVDLLRVERDEIVVGGGLTEGERVCTSPLQGALDGMRVRVIEGAEDPLLEPSPDRPSVATNERPR